MNNATLTHTAARAERSPFFLAAALAAYRARTGMRRAQLAAQLGTNTAGLARLGLCRRPETVAELERVAAYAGGDTGRLGALLAGATDADAAAF